MELKMESKMELKKQDKSMANEAMKTVQDLIQNCPDPTDVEIRKLLVIQGTILQQVGLEMLLQNRGTKNKKSLDLALRFMAGSREALKSGLKAST